MASWQHACVERGFKLFHLAIDLNEKNYLSTTHSEKLASLKTLYENWSAGVDVYCRKLGIEPI